MAELEEWQGVKCIMDIEGTKVPTIKCFEAIFARILNVIVSLAVIALFVMLVVGGFKYLTSGGDPKAAGSAKQTITYAILGIVLMAVAFIIFKLIETFTGVKVTIFEIPTFGV